MHRARGDRFVRASELPVCDNEQTVIKQREWLITVNLHTVIVKEIHKSKQFN